MSEAATPARIFVDMTMLSLLAIGGANAVVPEMHRVFVQNEHWLTSAEFAQLFAIAQIAPGPNITVFSLIGWRLAGFAGFFAASLAAIVPTCLVAAGVGLVMRRHADARWMRALRAGLAPVAIGLFLASGVVMARAADHDLQGYCATLATAALVLRTKLNPLAPLCAFAALALARSYFLLS
ncbi:MAG: chromate transporter [Hyphomicrobiales bacterium]|nr:chromate transporter [Hyphomicrobiales bacterium]